LRTLSSHLTRIRTKLVDPNSDSRLGWSDARLTSWLNQARDEFAAETQILFERTDSTLANEAYTYIKDYEGQSAYPLPEDTAAVTRCEWKNRMIPHLSMERIIRDNRIWNEVEGNVFAYGIEGNTLYKVNLPSETADHFTLERFILPTKLEDSTDYDDNFPLWADDAVELKVVARAYASEGAGQDKALATHYSGRYSSMMSRAKTRMSRLTRKDIVMGGSAGLAGKRPTVQLPWQYGRRVR